MECSHKTYNIYCDESTHLENDGQPYMIYGYVSIPIQFVKEIPGAAGNPAFGRQGAQGFII